MPENIRVELCGMESTVFRNPSDFTHIKTLPYFSLVQSVSGNYGIQINNETEYITPPGGMFFAPPQYTQKITHLMKNGEMEARWVFLNIEIDNAYSAELLYDFPVIPPSAVTEKLNSLLDSLFACEDCCDKMSLCYQLVKHLLVTAVPKNKTYNESILTAVDYIKKNYSEKITISRLVNLLHISESNLYATFKKQFDISPIAYLNDYRLVMASKLLKSSGDSIESVSRSVGIDDVRYFSKIFKRKFNMTPSSYRNNKLI